MSSTKENIRIGITHGDYNGIGYEVIIKALSHKEITDLFTPVIFGSSEVASFYAEKLKMDDFKFKAVKDINDIEDGVINIVEVLDKVQTPTVGRPSKEGGVAAVKALEKASKAIEEGEIDLLVTAPFDKNSVQSDTFKFPGHTEYLEDKFVVEGGRALMIMADDLMRVALVTTHLPLKEVPAQITKENVLNAIRDFNRALKMDFGFERPKIGVLSLNPHNGDSGMLGNEEIEFIIPAIEEAREEGIMAFGPLAADGLFGSGAYRNYDGVLAMYHDQGLAPFKALARNGGVNYTAGLDIIRTSPAHGTGYDIAGKGVADENSMRSALYMAIDTARRRARYLDMTENPLEIREPKAKEQKRSRNLPDDKEAKEEKNAEESIEQNETETQE